jgi:hypothetical protein
VVLPRRAARAAADVRGREQLSERPNLREALAVWALFGLMLTAVVVTYSRVPADELYHVSETGVAGGLGRALVALNFPIALAAVPLALIAALRIGERWAYGVGVVASVLCWVVAVPGVVDQADLDARPVNAIPAAGVGLALALTILAVARRGLGSPVLRLPGDPARLALAAVLVVVGLPWFFADLGVYIGHVPVLGDLYMSNELAQTAENPNHRVVHLGQHHGAHGVYLWLTALALTRVLPQIAGRLRRFLAFYLSLMLVYGLALVANDAWGEQVVARDWASWNIPSVLEPKPTLAWAVVLAAAVAVDVLLLRPRGGRARPS